MTLPQLNSLCGSTHTSWCLTMLTFEGGSGDLIYIVACESDVCMSRCELRATCNVCMLGYRVEERVIEYKLFHVLALWHANWVTSSSVMTILITYLLYTQSVFVYMCVCVCVCVCVYHHWYCWSTNSDFKSKTFGGRKWFRELVRIPTWRLH